MERLDQNRILIPHTTNAMDSFTQPAEAWIQMLKERLNKDRFLKLNLIDNFPKDTFSEYAFLP